MGFAAGAVFAGPFSETFGRNTVYIATMFLFSVFVMASALAPNFGAQLAFRFLAGFFGSTPLTCAGGSISDMWDPLEKSYAFSIFAIPGFGGPVLGPVIGSYIGIGNIGSWRWSEWITLILAGLVTGLILLFQSETYPPLLLKWKAQHLRRITGDDRFRAPMEITKTTLWSLLKIAMKRPFLLMTEPIVLLMAFYLTILYIVLFTFLSGYTFIFTNTYGVSQGLTNVIFVGMFVGILLAIPLVPFALHKTKQDLRKSASKGNAQFNPEVRLWFAMLGAPAIPISLFWMGWTARVSFPMSINLSQQRTADKILAVNKYLVSDPRICLIWLRSYMHFHECLYVYHRFLRDVRCISVDICYFHSVYRCGRYDSCGDSIL